MLLPRTCGGQSFRAAPSRQIFPLAKGHAPTRARASDDLPEALGPMMPSAVPPDTAKLTSEITGERAPGGQTVAFSIEMSEDGFGRGSCRDWVGMFSSNKLSLF